MDGLMNAPAETLKELPRAPGELPNFRAIRYTSPRADDHYWTLVQ
jgi:hypothetical protein